MIPVFTAQTLGCSARNYLMQAVVCMHFPGLSRSGSGSEVLHKGTDWVLRCWVCGSRLALMKAHSSHPPPPHWFTERFNSHFPSFRTPSLCHALSPFQECDWRGGAS